MRCQSSFALQFQTEWKSLFEVQQKIVPAQPRQVRLIEPPLTRRANFTAAGQQPSGGWQGGVQYSFITQPSVRITAAHIEADSAAAQDIAAAAPLAVTSTFPVVAGCADLVEVRVASTAAHARGTLIIDTDYPAVPHWQTHRGVLPAMNALHRHALCAALSMLALGGGALGQTPPQVPLRIGIIGAGHIGGTLAALWVSAGHEVHDLLAPSG